MNVCSRIVLASLVVTGAVALPGCYKPQGLKKGELVVWHWMTDREDALADLSERYQKETGIKMHLELYAPSEAYSSKVRASAQTDTLPDIFGVLGETRDLASFINAGHILNLAPAMLADNKAWYRAFFPKALASDTFQPDNQYGVPEGIYGVPVDVTNIQMLYNKDLFKQAGLDPEKPPTTWDEWMRDWQKLKAAQIPGFVSGWGETWMIDCFASNYAFNIMGEKRVLDTFRGRVPYTDPDWVRVFSLFDDLRKQGILVSGVVTMVNKNAEQTFANGKAAFAFNGSWCVNVYNGMNPNLNYGVILPPKASTAYPMKIWGGAGSSFMVNARSPNRDAAIAFLKWLTASAQQTTLATDTLNLPANRASAARLPKQLADFAAQMDATTHPSQWPLTENPTVTEAFDKGIQSILIGEKTPQQVASEVEAVKKQQGAS